MPYQVGTAHVEVKPSFRGWNREVRAQAAGPDMGRAGEDAGARFAGGMERSTSRLRTVLKGAVGAAAGVTAAAGAVGLRTASQMETANIAFTTMLGSGEKARAFLGDLAKFAAKTPFEFPELQTAAQSLISIGIDSRKVVPIMTTLGNVTAGMGTGSEGIKRATVAIQQMNAAGRITAEDLNQLRDAGIPVYDLLAKATGRTKAEVADMASKGKLGRVELEKMMSALETGKGLERFNGMMEKQSQSLTGLWSTLKDTFSQGMAQAIAPAIPMLKDGLGVAIDAVGAAMPRVQAGVASLVARGPAIVGMLTRVRDGARGLFDLVAKGDYTSNLRTALGLEEDSPVVARVLSIRDAVSSLLDKLKGQGAGATAGSVFTSLGRVVENLLRSLPALGPSLDVAGKAFGFLADHTDLLAKALPVVIAGFAAVRASQAANNVVGRNSVVGFAAQLVQAGLLIVANNRLAAATNRVTASQQLQKAAVLQATAAENGGLLTRLRATAATIAHTAAEKARSVASKAGAAAQWLLNAAMSANPIGLLIAALIALGVGLVVAYKKSETFRGIVQGAWAGIKAAASAVVGWFVNTAWPWLSSALQWIGDKASWLWQSIIQPYFRAMWTLWGSVFGWLKDTGWPILRDALGWVAGKISWLWTYVVSPYFGYIVGLWKAVFGWLKDTGWPWMRDAMGWIGDKVKSVWENLISPAFTAIESGAEAVKNAFVAAKDGIKTAWDGLVGVISGPIRSAITWINKNFIGKINTLLDKVGVSWRVPAIQIDQGSTSKGGRSLKGGSFAGGGWTGPGPRLAPAGIVHADEFVVQKSSRRSIESAAPGLLDAFNQYGAAALQRLGWLGYAIGGKVAGLTPDFLAKLAAWNDATGGRYRVNSGFRSIERQRQLWEASDRSGRMVARPGSSRHNFGTAADLAPGTTPAHRALARRFGLYFPMSYEPWHIQLLGAAAASGGGGLVGALRAGAANLFRRGAGALLGLAPSGLWGGVVKASLGRVVDLFAGRIRGMESTESQPSGGSVAGGAGAAQAFARSVLAQYGWGAGEWAPLLSLWNRESGWRWDARNPSSGAYGIPQSLPGSKMASAGADWRTNPATQIRWGLGYIKGRYGSPSGAWAHSQRTGWYDQGGRVKPLLFDDGGVLPPTRPGEFVPVQNFTGAPERLYRGDRPGGDQYFLYGVRYDAAGDVAADLSFHRRAARRQGAYAGR
jgi:tape measure domain-containing protein